MKNLLLATTALLAFAVAPAAAADMQAPRMVTKAPALAVWDWTGFYLGAYAGVGVERSRATDPTGVFVGEIDHIGSAFNGGVTAGYNWQATRNIVVGVEGDFGSFNLSDSAQNYAEPLVYESKTSWIATLRGRLGWTSGPNLSYVTAGAAWVKLEDSIDFTFGGGPASGSKVASGWTWGTGTETMLGGGWTAKTEYLYVDAGAGDTVSNVLYSVRADHRYHMQRFGVNYLFGSKAQPALQPHVWNGAYVGLVGGSAASETKASDPIPLFTGEFNNNGTGYSAGGQIGYNWQFAPTWVAGVEGDFSWLGIDRSKTDFATAAMNGGVKTSWMATARARLGYSTGPALLYVTGGGAWVNVRDTTTNIGAVLVEGTKTVSGYTVGAGIETVLAGNWVTRSEYLYIDAGNGATLITPNGAALQADHNYHLFRSALTYKFGD